MGKPRTLKQNGKKKEANTIIIISEAYGTLLNVKKSMSQGYRKENKTLKNYLKK